MGTEERGVGRGGKRLSLGLVRSIGEGGVGRKRKTDEARAPETGYDDCGVWERVGRVATRWPSLGNLSIRHCSSTPQMKRKVIQH